MSSNLKGVLSGTKPRTVISNADPNVTPQYHGLPRSSDFLKNSKAGLLSHRANPVMESVNVASVSTDDESKLYQDHQIVNGGTYFNGAGTLDIHSSLITPERTLIVATTDQANKSIRLPTATALITHLRGMYGPENVVAGLSWEIDYVNNSGVANNTTAFVNNTGATIVGTVSVGGFFAYSTGAVTVKNNVKLRFVLTSVEDTIANPYSYTVFSF